MPPTRPKSPPGRARSQLRPNDRQRSKTRPQGTPEAVSTKPPAFSRAAWDAALEAIQAHAARAAGFAQAHWDRTPAKAAAAAYIARHGAHVILSGIGVPALKWADAEAPWIAAFVARYNRKAATEPVIPITAPSHPPWRTDEPPRGVRCLVTVANPGARLRQIYVASISLDTEMKIWISNGRPLPNVVAWMLAPDPAAEPNAWPPQIRLEPGKFYRTESGSVWCCFKTAKLDGGRAWCVNHGSTHVQTFNLQGRSLFDSKLNLVAEVETPNRP